MIIEKTVDTWNELNDELFSESYNSSISRHRSTFAYRGVKVQSWPLRNSLTRLASGRSYDKLEENLLKQFRKYAFPHLLSREDDWHHLSVAQHHGLPTRLLDWTFSPHVALHFALNDEFSFDDTSSATDGAVWKVNFSECHDLLSGGLTGDLDALGARVFSVDALSKRLGTLEELNAVNSPTNTVAVFFEPPSLD